MDVAGWSRDHVDSVAEHGYTIVEDAIEPELVDALHDDLAAPRARSSTSQPAANSFEGAPHAARLQPARVRAASASASRCTRTCCPIVEGVLDPGCLVSSLSSIAILPGETAQPIHADDQLIPIPKPHPPTVCNSMWALTDFTEANGATRIIPGSHLADHSPDYGTPYDSIAAEMPKGTVLIWHGSLWHGGGANTTDERARRHRDELLRRLHPPAGEPAARHPARDGRARFSPRLRELVGYGVYNVLIGHINKQSPEQLLLDATAAASASTMVWDGIYERPRGRRRRRRPRAHARTGPRR